MAEDTVESLRASLVQANARAEEAERHNLWWSNRTRAAENERDAREAQRAACYADLTTERAARLRAEGERDVSLSEANDLRTRVERLVAGAAVLTERTEEAEEEVRLADFRVRSAETKADELLAKLAAAEAEVKRRDEYPHPCLICFGVRPASGKPCACNGTNNVYTAFDYLNAEAARLRLAYDDPTTDATDGAHPAWWRGSDAGVAGAVRIVNEALDGPLPLPGCVGGADLEAVRQRVAALRDSVARLVEAGDATATRLRALSYPEDVLVRWAAAKGAKP